LHNISINSYKYVPFYHYQSNSSEIDVLCRNVVGVVLRIIAHSRNHGSMNPRLLL